MVLSGASKLTSEPLQDARPTAAQLFVSMGKPRPARQHSYLKCLCCCCCRNSVTKQRPSPIVPVAVLAAPFPVFPAEANHAGAALGPLRRHAASRAELHLDRGLAGEDLLAGRSVVPTSRLAPEAEFRAATRSQ